MTWPAPPAVKCVTCGLESGPPKRRIPEDDGNSEGFPTTDRLPYRWTHPREAPGPLCKVCTERYKIHKQNFFLTRVPVSISP